MRRADAEVLVPVAELIDGGLLVGVAHEVDEPFQDLRIELQRVADGLSGTWRSPRRVSMCMKALLYTRCMPRVRTK